MQQIIIIFLVLFAFILGNAQEEMHDYDIYEPNKDGYTVDAKVIKVQFVYVQHPGGWIYNFTKTSDGSPYLDYVSDGDEYADSIINWTNRALDSSKLPNLGNSDRVIDASYRFMEIADPLYPTLDETLFFYSSCTDHTQTVDLLDAIGATETDHVMYLFMLYGTKYTPKNLGGCGDGNNSVRLVDAWRSYYDLDPDNMNDFKFHLKLMASLLVHETGHVFGLGHIYCDGSDEEIYEDIPTKEELKEIYGMDNDDIYYLCEKIPEGEIYVQSNNVMSGGNNRADFSYSPDQIGQVNYHLCYDKSFVWLKPPFKTETKIVDASDPSEINRPYPITGQNIEVLGNLPLEGDKPTILIASNSIKFKSGTYIKGAYHFRAFLMEDNQSALKSANSNLINKKEDITSSSPNENQVSVSPIPSTGIFEVRFEKTSNIHISIYNISGAMVDSFESSEKIFYLDLSKHNPGVYFLNLRTENSNITKKILLK